MLSKNTRDRTPSGVEMGVLNSKYHRNSNDSDEISPYMSTVADSGKRVDNFNDAEGLSHYQPLPLITKCCYSVGHVLNDACASMWFSYLLLYLKSENLSAVSAGVVLFCGQIADAMATPVVGILSDKSNGIPALGLGKRKFWNLLGVLVVTASFLFVFGFSMADLIVRSRKPTEVERTVAYSVFASLFNFGWAAVQVSHMAMIPDLTNDDGERVLLNSARYGFTVISNCIVFLAMLAILHFYNGGDPNNDSNPISYRILTFFVLGVGLFCSFIFLVGTSEKLTSHHILTEVIDSQEESYHGSRKSESKDEDPISSNTTNSSESILDLTSKSLVKSGIGCIQPGPSGYVTWREWLKNKEFYQVMLVYGMTRLATNVSQVYLPFFILKTLHMSQVAIAILPLIMYLAQLITTMLMKRMSARWSRKQCMNIGSIFFGIACCFMMMLKENSSGGMYAAVFFLGIGCAVVMVISVSLEADLVGTHTESGAFVYGVCSFADKLSNGAVILVIQFYSEINDSGAAGDGTFIRYVNGFVPMAAVAVATFITWTIKFPSDSRTFSLRRIVQRLSGKRRTASDSHLSLLAHTEEDKD